MLRIEFERAIRRNSFRIALIIGILIGTLEVISNPVIRYSGIDFYDYSIGVYSNWIMYDIDMYKGILYIIFPILASIGYCDAYVEDIKSGFIKNILVRYKKSRYLVVRFLVTFIIGGVLVVVPLIINLILYLTLIPAIQPNIFWGSNLVSAKGFLPDIYFNYPMLHVAVKTVIFFLYGGVFATIGLCFSTLVKNRYVVTIIPFGLYIFLEISFNIVKLYNFSPSVFLFYDKAYNNIVPGLAIGLLSLSFIVFFVGGKYNEVI